MSEDVQRAIDMTGSTAETLGEALDQWENERGALSQLMDENLAMEITFRRYEIVVALADTLINTLEASAQMFITQAHRNKIQQFREQLQKLGPHRTHGKLMIEDAKEHKRKE
jgi:hypothetical protein